MNRVSLVWLCVVVFACGAGCSSTPESSAGPVSASSMSNESLPTESLPTESVPTGSVSVGASPLAVEGTVDVGGAAIRYQTAGVTSDPPLTFLFLHGAAFTSDTWVENGILEASVQGSTAQSIAIDLPGYGDSPSTSLANDEFVPAVMEALGLVPATTIVISPSMSGGFSLPALTAGFLDDLGGFVGVAPSGSSSFADSLSAPLRVPALAIWGDGDGADPQAAAQALADGFVDGDVVVLSDAGHAAYNQQPEAFTAVLRDFANGLDACDFACFG